MDLQTAVLSGADLRWVGLAATLLGVTGSLHCALMCGPLACAAALAPAPGGGPAPKRWKSLAAYHGARLSSYVLVGGLFGSMGMGMSRVLSVSVLRFLPWVMAATFVAAALDVGRFLPALPGARWLSRGLMRVGQKLSSTGKAAAIGASTGLLPCGLLYGVMLIAMTTGSAWTGAAIGGAFALGAAPMLLAVQWQTGLWKRLGAKGQFVVKRVLPLAAAVLLVVRSLQAPGSCCH